MPHFRPQGRLIADGRGHAPEQRRDFRARLGEAEDVVDEEQHVLALIVAEVFRDRQCGKRHSQSGAGRLVHLTVDQRGLIDDAGFAHLQVQVIAFAGALSDAGKNRIAAVMRGDIVNELLDDHGLSDAGASEESDLPTLGIWFQEVDHFDPCFQNFGLGLLLGKRGGRSMDGPRGLRLNRPLTVHGFAEHIDQSAQGLRPHRHGDWASRVLDIHATDKTFCSGHGDRAHPVFAEMLGHFQRQMDLGPAGLRVLRSIHPNRIVDLRQVSIRKFRIDNRPYDLNDLPCTHRTPLICRFSAMPRRRRQCPSIPS